MVAMAAIWLFSYLAPQNRKTSEAVALWCSAKKEFLEISQNSQENTCAFFNKVASGNYMKKETLAQVFSREFYEILKNIFYYRTPLVVASKRGFYHITSKCLKYGQVILLNLKVHECRFENLPTSSSLYESNMLMISH